MEVTVLDVAIHIEIVHLLPVFGLVLRQVFEEPLVEPRVALLIDGTSLPIVAEIVVVAFRIEPLRRVAAAKPTAAPASAEIRMAVRHLRHRHRSDLGALRGSCATSASVLCGGI